MEIRKRIQGKTRCDAEEVIGLDGIFRSNSSLDRMRFPTFPRTILWAGVLGLVLPLVVMALFWLHVFRIAAMWLIYISPSSIMLMATREHGSQLRSFRHPRLQHRHQRCSLRCRCLSSLVFGLGYPILAMITPRWNNDLTMRWSECSEPRPSNA
jgi:hypothetical protein